jgi:hypothetical protein
MKRRFFTLSFIGILLILMVPACNLPFWPHPQKSHQLLKMA